MMLMRCDMCGMKMSDDEEDMREHLWSHKTEIILEFLGETLVEQFIEDNMDMIFTEA